MNVDEACDTMQVSVITICFIKQQAASVKSIMLVTYLNVQDAYKGQIRTFFVKGKHVRKLKYTNYLGFS